MSVRHIQVEDPSLPNDEGITALHNAVCAGHTGNCKVPGAVWSKRECLRQ